MIKGDMNNGKFCNQMLTREWESSQYVYKLLKIKLYSLYSEYDLLKNVKLISKININWYANYNSLKTIIIVINL